MTKLLTSSWMTVIIGTIVYLAATVAFWKVPAAPAPAPDASATASVNGPSWEFTNPEADQLVAELKTEKQLLDKREQELNDLALRLQSEQGELQQATQTVHLLQTDFDNMTLRVQTEEIANLKKLAKVYAAMAPDTAANILGDLDDATIVKTLVFMKEPETAAILESFAKKGTNDAQRAATISDRIRVAVVRPPPAP